MDLCAVLLEDADRLILVTVHSNPFLAGDRQERQHVAA